MANQRSHKRRSTDLNQQLRAPDGLRLRDGAKVGRERDMSADERGYVIPSDAEGMAGQVQVWTRFAYVAISRNITILLDMRAHA